MFHSVRIAGLGLGALLALGACDTLKDAATTGDGAPVADASDDACGAAGRQDLVGQSAGVLDPATLPEGTRVLFPGMAATMDFRADRLNVSVGAGDKVDRVFCG